MMPKKKLIMFGAIGLVALLVLGGGGFFAYKKFFGGPAKPVEKAEAAEGEKSGEEAGAEKGGEGEKAAAEGEKGGEGAAKAEAVKPGEGMEGVIGPTHSLTFIVNLADTGRSHYLKVIMDLELDNKKTLKELQAATPKVRDAIITLLSSLSTDQLTTVADKQKLKNAILHRLNSLLTSGKVKEVYFSEFMVQ